jgi:hypothetical protein
MLRRLARGRLAARLARGRLAARLAQGRLAAGPARGYSSTAMRPSVTATASSTREEHEVFR